MGCVVCGGAVAVCGSSVGVNGEDVYFADCVNLFSDASCSMPRGSATLGRLPQTRYCLRSTQTCAAAPDFQEAYSFDCQKDNSSSIKIWTRTTHCSPDTPNFNVTVRAGECVFAFTDTRPPTGPVYVRLECDVEVRESETRSFLVSFGINAVLAVLLLTLFCCLRHRLPHLYETRVEEIDDIGNLAPNNPPQPGYFGWLTTSFRLTDQQMFEQCGLDGLMYTLLFRTLLKAFAACFVLTAIIILPVNAHGGLGLTGVDGLSIANVSDGNQSLNAHLILTVVYSVIIMYALRHSYRKYTKFRYRYLATAHANNYAVLVRDIPPDVPTDAAVLDYFRSMHEGAEQVTRFVDVKDLPAITKKRKQARKQLERALHKQEQGGEATMRRGGCLGCGGDVVDAVHHWQTELNTLNDTYARRLREVTESPSYLPSAIVTFKTVKDATIASQVRHSRVPFTWTIDLAAEARDLLWSNLALPHTARLSRSVAVTIVTIILMIVWTIPVSFVISLFSLQSLSRVIPQLKTYVANSSVIGGFVEGFLASIILLIIMALIPSVMRWLSHLEGHPTESCVGRASTVKLFWFQVVNIFLVSLVFGSVLPILDDLRDNPGQLIDLLGGSVPRTGLFFTSFVMVRACVGYPVQLLRVAEALVSFFSYVFFSATPAERNEAFKAIHFDIPAYISADMLVILVGMTFSNVNPIIVPFFLLYLALGYITNRYLLFFVYKQRYDSGGQLWPLIFNQLMMCLIISQIAVAAVLAVKTMIVQACLLLVLVMATGVFWYYMHTGRGQVGNDLALEVAVSVDSPMPSDLARTYKQPELKEEVAMKPRHGPARAAKVHPTTTAHARPKKQATGRKGGEASPLLPTRATPDSRHRTGSDYLLYTTNNSDNAASEAQEA
ncbi:hypothetical protein PTSG_09322 [Salpingoeca rosetta]|uniref:CSC1/OSCA1-like 7TM region domain-containing protein n=1 Tax=Salpingoeca rosetta (strain ATCC 50818 / BSB-021) TaxID=946362 RepID=F2UMA8_SALR5|nr:uncharacterized protein PTSG_09322 [Salpingoeca rosetta]EGD78257.1 hypothetical protein PTSG_09322 [Salpingoeca rosetta]|eukprot:XP_004989580.1 hypothetical protein PTSG_09322 [Salpingoeca rosetta]